MPTRIPLLSSTHSEESLVPDSGLLQKRFLIQLVLPCLLHASTTAVLMCSGKAKFCQSRRRMAAKNRRRHCSRPTEKTCSPSTGCEGICPPPCHALAPSHNLAPSHDLALAPGWPLA
ncbi:unnamed protein product [Lota lota]